VWRRRRGEEVTAPAPASGTLLLVNGSTHYMDAVYVAASSDPSWGTSRGAIPAGTSMSLGLDPGSWDARAVSVGVYSTYFTEYYGANIVAGQTFQLNADDSSYSGSMKVANGNPSYWLTGVYVVMSPNGGVWGPNQLSSSLAPSTGYINLVGMPAHSYDVKCVWTGRTPSDTVIGTGFAVSSYALTTVTCN